MLICSSGRCVASPDHIDLPTPFPSHARLLLPAHHNDLHKRQVPRPSLHPHGQLANDGRHRHRNSGLQQRESITPSTTSQVCQADSHLKTTKLGQAYGVCVILVTFITTNLVTLVAIIVWRLHPALVFAVWLPFVMLDGLYLTSALTKVPEGAWFTILLAVLLASFFSLWRYGKEKQWACEARETSDLSSMLTTTLEGEGGLALSKKYGGGALSRVEGFGIFFDKSGAFVPTVYEQWLRKFRAQLDVVVFMHMRALSIPHVDDGDRFTVSRTSVKNVYRLVIRHGYNDHVITPDLARLVYEEIRKALLSGSLDAASNGREAVVRDDAALAARLEHFDDAFATQSLYLVGKEQLRITKSNNFAKRTLLGVFLWVGERELQDQD